MAESPSSAIQGFESKHGAAADAGKILAAAQARTRLAALSDTHVAIRVGSGSPFEEECTGMLGSTT